MPRNALEQETEGKNDLRWKNFSSFNENEKFFSSGDYRVNDFEKGKLEEKREDGAGNFMFMVSFMNFKWEV